MRKNIKLLENRVSRVLKRLEQLSDERNRLAQEVESLQERLETLERSGPAELESMEGGPAQRAHVVDELRQVLADLRSG